MSINRVTISGNLTRDAELRSTASGTSVLGFGVAVNERRKNQQTGEWEDHPNFVDCTLFGKRAESLAQYLTKGMKVAIEGHLHWSQWEQDGKRRSKLDVIVDEIDLMSKAERNGNPQNGYYQAPQAQQPAYQQGYQQQAYAQQPVAAAVPAAATAVGAGYYDEEIPF